MAERTRSCRVLVVDDDCASSDALKEWVEAKGHSVSAAESLEKARVQLAEAVPDLVLLDLELPDGSGIDLLADLENHPQTEVVIVTGHASVDSAVESMRRGAIDYLPKPVDPKRLAGVLRKLEQTLRLRHQVETLRHTLRDLGRFGPMVGASPAIQSVYEAVERVAPTDAPVLVIGETGTGKELVARAVHQFSERSDGPWVPLNCGAVTPNLIESEIFGHERGSFTGADRARKGVFEVASGGTLFLDEITEMPAELQVKLLRVLETGKFSRVGGERPIETDVRIVAATNRDPQEAVEEGFLREDLMYRLMVFPILIPPLRERPGDVLPLAQHFLSGCNAEAGTSKRLSDEAVARLEDCDWPGNVRQLQNVLRHAHIVAEGVIEPEHLELAGSDDTGPGSAGGSPATTSGGSTHGNVAVRVGMTVKEAEKALILATLQATDENKRAAAKQLGISLKTLYNRLNVYEAEGP